MAACSSSLSIATSTQSSFLFLPTDSEKFIKQKIRAATAFAITELANHFREKWEKTAPSPSMTHEELKEKALLLYQGPWSPIAFYTRCIDLNQQKLITNFRAGNYLIKGYMNPENFDLVGDPSIDEIDRTCFFFKIKKGKDPYLLTMDILKDFSIIECGVAIRIAQYRALAMCLGRVKFNTLFTHTGFGSVNFSPRVTRRDQPLIRLMKTITTKNFEKDTFVDGAVTRGLKTGDFCYFKGHPNYHVKQPYGMTGGYNMICTQSGSIERFTAFGLPPNRTEEEIIEHLMEGFNIPAQQWHLKLPSDEVIAMERQADEEAALLGVPKEFTVCTKESILGFKHGRVDRMIGKVLRSIASTSDDKLEYSVSFN